MSTAKPLPTILGALLALLGLATLTAGGALLLAHTTQRDADGFYMSPDAEITTPGSAVVSEDLQIAVHPGDWFPAEGDLTFRIEVTPVDDQPVFVGVAELDELTAYVDPLAHATVTRIDASGVRLDEEAGTAPARPPIQEDFWVASTAGAGTQTLTVDAAPGRWALAVLNADGSAGIDVVAEAGVRTDLLLPIAIGLLAVGLVIVAAGAGLVLLGVTSGPRDTDPRDQQGGGGPVEPLGATGSPVRLEGELDPELSRGLWLVKWALAIPHLIVLGVLWAVFAVLTFVAGVAILFTGRYPRGIFDLNVGILRWNWRVTYYAFGVLGTDRYPPFSLDPGDYPARLDIAYPGELSRGLVLVKWWLLAIPHYLVLALLTGGVATWTFDVGAPDGAEAVIGGGLIGILALIAGVVLLFRGHYPTGIFDMVMGMQRWVYRVIAYAALMTDDYPPFRLDTGGHEPTPRDDGPTGSGGQEGVGRELTHA